MGKFADIPRTLRTYKISRWYALAAVFGGPVAIFGSTIAIGYIGGAFAASAALLTSVVGAFAAKVWYGENITRRAWMGIGMIIMGGIFIWNPSQMIAEIMNPASPEGVWIGYLGGFLSAIGWGLEGAIAARVLDVTDADSGLVVRFISESMIWLILLIPVSMFIFGFDVMVTALLGTFTSLSFLIWMVIVALSLGVCYIALYKAYPLIGVGRGLSIGTLYVVFAILGLSIFMGVPIGWWIIVGSSIAIVGIFVMYWESSDSVLECTRDCKPALSELKHD
jgi:drug/metabolite transporter (DMT)-like permease